jgi:hypothetical protein
VASGRGRYRRPGTHGTVNQCPGDAHDQNEENGAGGRGRGDPSSPESMRICSVTGGALARNSSSLGAQSRAERREVREGVSGPFIEGS